MNDSSDWALDRDIFLQIQKLVGNLEVDLFASRLNHQLDKYVSWKPDGRLSTVLERDTGVCLSTICNDREMSGKNNERQSDIDINSSHLAGQAVVPTDITNVDSGSNTASQLPGTSEVPTG